MTQHDDSLPLGHMLAHAREAVEMIRGKQRTDLDRERILELALVRLVEIVGEAASRISDEKRAKSPSIPWLHVVGMRNRLVHAYDKIDLQILWDTIVDDLPPLILDLEKVLDE